MGTYTVKRTKKHCHPAVGLRFAVLHFNTTYYMKRGMGTDPKTTEPFLFLKNLTCVWDSLPLLEIFQGDVSAFLSTTE